MSSLTLVYASVLTAGFGALFVSTYAIARVPAQQPNTLGIRGLKRVRALQNSELFRSVEGSLRWLGMQVRRALGEGAQRFLDRKLMLAGDFLGLLPEEFVALCLFCGAAGVGVGWGYASLCDESLWYAAGAGALGALAPYSRLTSLEEERKRKVDLALPPMIDLLVLSLSAGLDFPGALRQVVGKSSNPGEPLIEEVGFLLQELNVGKTRKAALSQLAERVPVQSLREFVGAVVQAEEHGNPLARVLQIHAEVSRQQRSTRAEEAAAKAGVKMMVPMVLVFGAILILIVAPMVLSLQANF